VLGHVEAQIREVSEAVAADAFNLNAEKRSRLVVQERPKAPNSEAHRKLFVRRSVGQSSLAEDKGGFPCEIEIFSLMLPLLPQW